MGISCTLGGWGADTRGFIAAGFFLAFFFTPFFLPMCLFTGAFFGRTAIVMPGMFMCCAKSGAEGDESAKALAAASKLIFTT